VALTAGIVRTDGTVARVGWTTQTPHMKLNGAGATGDGARPGAGRDQAGLSVAGARRCFWQTVCVLAAFSVAHAFGLLGPPVVSVGLLMVALVVIGRRQGASVTDLGLGRADARAGLSYGAAALGIVLVVLLLAAAVPATNGFLHDTRAEIPGRQLLYEIAVPIVLLTAVPEELAFRGVLLGSAGVLWGRWRGSLVTSALFGLWHIAPTLHTMSDNSAVSGATASAGGRVLLVLGAVAVTFLAGLAFCWLRLRSSSLLAPVIAHAATNGLALTVAWLAIH